MQASVDIWIFGIVESDIAVYLSLLWFPITLIITPLAYGLPSVLLYFSPIYNWIGGWGGERMNLDFLLFGIGSVDKVLSGYTSNNGEACLKKRIKDIKTRAYNPVTCSSRNCRLRGLI